MIESITSDFIAGVLSSLFTVIISATFFVVWTRRRYKDWKIVLVKDGEKKAERPLGIGTAKLMLTDPHQGGKELKSVCADLKCFINCWAWDITTTDKKQRTFTINFTSETHK